MVAISQTILHFVRQHWATVFVWNSTTWDRTNWTIVEILWNIRHHMPYAMAKVRREQRLRFARRSRWDGGWGCQSLQHAAHGSTVGFRRVGRRPRRPFAPDDGGRNAVSIMFKRTHLLSLLNTEYAKTATTAIATPALDTNIPTDTMANSTAAANVMMTTDALGTVAVPRPSSARTRDNRRDDTDRNKTVVRISTTTVPSAIGLVARLG